ncbi:response regulator [Herbaspirillum frisingense]|uniref:hybrid sensor histidine kinase/response regulator n=1 Tax=Herbaspirillum frisingense TaxID=92645 RepID=UPI00160009CE|nr:hybrid sensor histidine kinase/response regulator [Herbaspirillum frisingense]QNB06093.1 response regulator [Herbaspirillum frisingense]
MPNQLLARSERYYRRLLYGSTCLLSLAIVASLGFLGSSAFEQFRDQQISSFIAKQQMIATEVNRLSARVTQFAEMYSPLQSLFLNEQRSLVSHLNLQGETASIANTPDSLAAVPFSLVTRLSPKRDQAYLDSLLQLLRHASVLPIFNPNEPGLTFDGFIYTADHSFLAISPPLDEGERLTLERAGEAAFIDGSTQRVDQAFLSENMAAVATQGGGGQPVIWLNASRLNFIGRDAVIGLAVRIYLTGQGPVTAVFYVPPAELRQFFLGDEQSSDFLLLGNQKRGEVLYAPGPLLQDDVLQNGVLQKIYESAVLGKEINYFRHGKRFFLTQSIQGPGWIMVQSFTRDDVINYLLHGSFVTGCFWGLFALLFVWMATLYFERFVIGPLQKKAVALIDERQFSQTIIDTLPIGIAVYAPGSRSLLLQNAVAAAMLEHAGVPHVAFYQDIVAKCRHHSNLTRTGNDTLIEAELRSPEGQINHLGVAWSGSRYGGQNVVLLGLLDMNVRKAHEALLQEAHAQAQRSSAEKSIFLAHVSHEIRTPLHGAIGHMELLARDHLTDQQQQRVELIRHSFKMLMSLVDDVLDITKIETHSISLRREPVCINDLLEECAQLFAPLAQNKGLAFYCLPSPALDCMVEGDQQRLTQILQNLTGNALKFTERGCIVLSASGVVTEHGEERIRIAVADTGIGLSADESKRIFKPMEQANDTISRRFGGTGLGLSLCRSLSGLMDGDILLESEPGKGSVFSVELPLHRIDAKSRTPSEPSPLSGRRVSLHCQRADMRGMLAGYLQSWGANLHEASGDVPADSHLVAEDSESAFFLTDERASSNIVLLSTAVVRHTAKGGRVRQVSAFDRQSWLGALTLTPFNATAPQGKSSTSSPSSEVKCSLDILVAEDDHVNLLLMEHQLKSLGCTNIRLARDGAQALEQWQQRRPDVLITDLGMPRLNGVELAKEIRRQDPQTTIVAATAAGRSKETDGQLSLFNEVIYKPASLNELQQVLQKFTEHHESEQASTENESAIDFSLEKILMDAFRQSWPKDKQRLSEALQEGEVQVAVRILHRLQGGLQAMGLDAVASESLTLQSAFEEGEPGVVNQCRVWIRRVETATQLES